MNIYKAATTSWDASNLQEACDWARLNKSGLYIQAGTGVFYDMGAIDLALRACELGLGTDRLLMIYCAKLDCDKVKTLIRLDRVLVQSVLFFQSSIVNHTRKLTKVGEIRVN